MPSIKPTKTPTYKTPLTAWVMALSLGLTACGGGGSSTATPTPTPTPSGTPSSTPTPTPSGTPSATPSPSGTPSATPTPVPAPAPTAAECPIGDYKSALLAEINTIRSKPQVCGGVTYPSVGRLTWDSQLESAAARHSNDLAANNYWYAPFPHQGTDGSTLRDRVPAAGYNYATAGENVAGGQTSVSDVFYLGGGYGWMSSAGHCVAIMTAAYVDVGASCKYNFASDYQYYWTLVMGKRQ